MSIFVAFCYDVRLMPLLRRWTGRKACPFAQKGEYYD
nr:MAG TPA: hypothetical protein [Caudoviricetes sp.]